MGPAARRLMTLRDAEGRLHEFIDVVEWKEDPADYRRGTATIKIFELPVASWRDVQGQEEERPRVEIPGFGGHPGSGTCERFRRAQG